VVNMKPMSRSLEVKKIDVEIKSGGVGGRRSIYPVRYRETVISHRLRIHST
jgi:hypothetical protein